MAAEQDVEVEDELGRGTYPFPKICKRYTHLIFFNTKRKSV